MRAVVKLNFRIAMKKNEVRDLIFNTLAPALVAKGFQLNKKDWRRVRAFPGGNQTIGIPCTGTEPEFKFTLVVTIRLDAVENVRNLFNEAPKEYHAATKTFAGRLDRFMARDESVDENFMFPAATPEQVQAALARLLPVIQNAVLPFLDQHRDVPSLAAAMKLAELPASLTRLHEATAPLVVARLARSPDFPAIASGYRQLAKDLPAAEREKLQNLVVHLETLQGSIL